MKKYFVLMIIISIITVGCSPKEKPIGGDKDEHGCLPAAGYTWCEAKQKCLREWEEPCEEKAIELKAKEFCNEENVYGVYVCDDYIKVVSSLDGAGSRYYKEDGTEVECPVVSPDSMSGECRKLLFEPACEEREIC